MKLELVSVSTAKSPLPGNTAPSASAETLQKTLSCENLQTLSSQQLNHSPLSTLEDKALSPLVAFEKGKNAGVGPET